MSTRYKYIDNAAVDFTTSTVTKDTFYILLQGKIKRATAILNTSFVGIKIMRCYLTAQQCATRLVTGKTQDEVLRLWENVFLRLMRLLLPISVCLPGQRRALQRSELESKEY